MSADNWSYCAHCVALAMDAHAAKMAEVEEAYGVLPLAEWEALRAKVPVEFDAEAAGISKTVREDYECGIWGGDTARSAAAEFYVVFKAHCNVCGAGVEFEHTGTLEGPTQ